MTSAELTNAELIQYLKQLKSFEDINYPFASKIDLLPFQKIGVLYMYLTNGTILGDSTGLGKTIQTIAMFEEFLKIQPNLRFLVFTISSAVKQWYTQIRKFSSVLIPAFTESYDTYDYMNKVYNQYKLPYQPSKIAKEGRIESYNAWVERYHVAILHYNLLTHDSKEIRSVCNYLKGNYIVIFDEASILKNSLDSDNDPKTVKVSKFIADNAFKKYALTATPLQTHLSNLYGIYSIINPSLFTSYENFQDYYMNIIPHPKLRNPKTGRPIPVLVGYKNLDHLTQRIETFYIGRRKDVVAKQLPKLVLKPYLIPMSENQKRYYKVLKKGFLLKDDMNEEAHTFQKLVLMQQVADSLEIVPDVPENDSTKVDELIRVIREELAGEKVVVFSHFKTMINILKDKLSDLNPLTITGDVDLTSRDENQALFSSSPDHNLLLITTAGNKALNLQAASYLIVFDLLWNYGELSQLIGRLVRIGSEHANVTALFMLSENTIEEHIYNILIERQLLVKDCVVDDMETLTKNFLSINELKKYFFS